MRSSGIRYSKVRRGPPAAISALVWLVKEVLDEPARLLDMLPVAAAEKSKNAIERLRSSPHPSR